MMLNARTASHKPGSIVPALDGAISKDEYQNSFLPSHQLPQLTYELPELAYGLPELARQQPTLTS
jgi:hypothetical protein